MDFSLALIELSVVFGVAGWITYLQKGAQAGGGTGAAAEIKDGEEGARTRAMPAKSGVEGRTVTLQVPLRTTRGLQCRDGTGTYVRLTEAAFSGRQFECAAAARPAAAGRLSGMKIEPKNA